MRFRLLLSCALVLSGGLSGRSSEVTAGVSSSDTRAVVAGNTEFAADLYAKLRASHSNFCFSPYSLSAALAMTYGGARGETAKQMARTLHFNLPPGKLHPAFAALEADLKAIQSRGKVQLVAANSLWPQKGYSFLPDYLELCRRYYGVYITPVDFRDHTEVAREMINNWAATRTDGKVRDLLKPRALDKTSRLVLVEAIYFRGSWAKPFEANFTASSPFFVSPQKSVTVPLMQQTGQFDYAEFPQLQVLALPYSGAGLSMLVLLPSSVWTLDRLETQFTARNLSAWTRKLKRQRVEVYLPKFRMSSEFSLADTLQDLGMREAFHYPQADFSGMDGTKNLFISAVVHQAFVSVDEAGTEAAAASAVAMKVGSAPPRQPLTVFRADHPFLFLIRDNRNGSILFLGQISDPTG